MKIINREQVSYVRVFKATEGLESWGGNFWKYTYYNDEYFRFLWLFPIKTLERGFYRDGVKSKWYRIEPENLDENSWYTLFDQVYTYPHIHIYSGGSKIHTQYFKTYKALEKHLEDKYDNVTIRYE